jgi:hypothetical protein
MLAWKKGYVSRNVLKYDFNVKDNHSTYGNSLQEKLDLLNFYNQILICSIHKHRC